MLATLIPTLSDCNSCVMSRRREGCVNLA
jgi:hypothetical protein